METIQRLFDVHPWKLETTHLDVTNRRLQESLTSIGNGYMGMRGNFEEHYSGDHHLGTYLAGVWYPDKTRVGWWKNGYPDYFGKVINAINFAAIDLQVNDQVIDLATLTPDKFRLTLDLKTGILSRYFEVTLDEVIIAFEFERFFSIVHPEMAFIQVTARCLQGEATLSLTSKLDNTITNEDSNYEEHFWETMQEEVSPLCSTLTAQTIPNQFGIEQFTVTAAMRHNHTPDETFVDKDCVINTFKQILSPDDSFTLTKQVFVVTSRDVPDEHQVTKVTDYFEQIGPDYAQHKAEQMAAWAKRWELADVQINGDDAAQQGIRYNLFQLFATYYGEDERLNIGPKGFTGEKYGGATYWDTEAYAVPLYLALAEPQVTKNLLRYRYNQLPQAKENAQKQGLKGALYPMVTFTGIECHNEWEITFEEIHRNGAIAYAIYNYTNYTGDTTYLANEGLHVLSEIARFWADRVHYSERQQCYMIHGVTGPNEYENNVNNNWYTNTIARWVLMYTLASYRQFAETTSVHLSVAEQEKWQDIIDHFYLPYDEERAIFIQHDTFLDKELIPVSHLDTDELPLNQHWSWDRILRSCFIKQADVLQGLYFFNNQFTLTQKRQNFLFYEPMTVHESSLSPSIHAILAAELGLEAKAMEMYERTARLDLDNYNHDTQDGLHITSMTGSWLAIVQGFAQMKTFDNQLSFAPMLPQKWHSFAFHITYRERLLKLQITSQEFVITKLSGEDLAIVIYDQPYHLTHELAIPLQVRVA